MTSNLLTVISSAQTDAGCLASLGRGRKRGCEDVDEAEICYARLVFDGPDEVRKLYTDFYPKRRSDEGDLPLLPPPQYYAAIPKHNPFLGVMKERYAELKPARDLPPNTKVNGYLKFYKRPVRGAGALPAPAHDGGGAVIAAPSSPSSQVTGPAAWQASVVIVHDPQSRQRRLTARRRYPPSIPAHMTDPVKLELDTLDTRLFEWYCTAICSGRTLLKNSNGWLNDLAPMALQDPFVNHCLLALSAGYAMDYDRNEKLRDRANYHFFHANQFLDQKLQDPTTFTSNVADAVVAGIRLMWSDDIIQWELRKDRRDVTQLPRWYQAVSIAKLIMTATDPGCRYYRPRNVQATSARISNANMLAFVNILCQPVMPLAMFDARDNGHSWLLEGSAREMRCIYGGTGMCPKLLHMLGQITLLCKKMAEDPTSTVIPMGAEAIERRLVNFMQWSELSEGYPNTETLLAACRLGPDGMVKTAKEVTELTGECWVQTCKIYLQCRFFRRPRRHPKVQQPLKVLVECVRRMPSTGTLFTSQSPLFPVFIMGFVAVDEDDRDVARKWFETVLSCDTSRSSVPPVWDILRQTWEWIDDEGGIDGDVWTVDMKTIGAREPWWEAAVANWWSWEGLLSLV